MNFGLFVCLIFEEKTFFEAKRQIQTSSPTPNLPLTSSKRHLVARPQSKFAGDLIKEFADSTGTAIFNINVRRADQITQSSNATHQNLNFPSTNHVNYDDIFKKGYSPINIDNLTKMLSTYPNKKTAKFLEDGFKNGFSLQYTGPRVHYFANNLKSAEQAPDIVLQKINKEIDSGRVAGPFNCLPIANLRISPLGLVPKKGGDFRPIHHLHCITKRWVSE